MNPQHFVHHVSDVRQTNLIQHVQNDEGAQAVPDVGEGRSTTAKVALVVLFVVGIVLIGITLQSTTP